MNILFVVAVFLFDDIAQNTGELSFPGETILTSGAGSATEAILATTNPTPTYPSLLCPH